MVAHEPSHNRDGPRKLGKRTFVRRRPSTKHFSASGKMSLIAVAFTTIILGSRNASATNSHRAASPIPHRPWNLSQLRGGSKSDRILSSKKGGDQDLDDEDLDEYIDFLLAYADDKATEADNPLFHGMESNQIEQDDQEEQDEQEEDEKQDVEEDLGVKPLVNDVNDDKQIDEMVETLIASVDDEDVEGATKLEIQSEESSEEIEMVTTSLVAKEIETAQDISAESAPEEITAGIMAEGTELTGVLSLKEEENIGEVAADFAAEEVAVEIVEEEIEVVTPDLSVEKVERIEEVVGESAAEVTPTASLEDDIGLATTDSSVQEVENIESTYAETTTEDIPETAFVEIQTPVNDSIVEANTEDSASETPVVEMVNDEKKISSHSDIDEESIEQVESESFYLGSSAVENMPVPSVVSLSNLSSADDDAALSADAALTAQPTKRVPLFTSLMRKIGLRKEEPGSSDAATVDASQEGETVSSAEETVEVHEKTESAIESSNVMELTTTSTTESETQLNAAKEITDTDRIEDVVLDSSDGSEEPSITVAELDRETSVSEDVDIVVQVEDTAEDEISSETETLETSEVIALDSADEVRSQQVTTRVTSLARQYYQGAWGSVKDLWSKKRWLRKETEDSPPERDYMKIYQKYYATNHQTLDADVNPSQERRNRVSSAFLRPWGTVSKYFKSPEQSEATSTTTNYYSIGIQGFVPDDLTADASSEAYGDDENGNVVETDVAFAEMEVGDDEVAVEEEELSVAEALDTEETSGSVDDLDRLVDEDVICEEEHEEAPVLSEAEVQVDSETVYKIDSDVANDDVAIKEEEASDVVAEALEIEETSNSVEDLNLQVDDDEEQQLFLVSEAEVYSEVANESEIETDVDNGVAIEEEEAPVVTEEAPDIEENSDSVEDLDLQIDEDSALEEEKEEEVVVEKEEAPVVSDAEVGVDSEAVNEIEVDVVESELEVDDGVAIEEEEAPVVTEEAPDIEETSDSVEDLDLQIDEDSALEEEKEEEEVVEKEEAPVVSDAEVGVDSEAVNEIEVDVVESVLEVDDGVAIEEEEAPVVTEEAPDIEETSDSVEDLDLQIDDDAALEEEEEEEAPVVSDAEVGVESELVNEIEVDVDVVESELEVDDGVAIEEEDASVVIEEAPDIEETSDSVEDLDLQIDDDTALEEEEEAPVVSDAEVEVESELVNEIEVDVDVVESELEVDDGVAIEEEDASVVIEEALEIEESSESIEDLELVDEGDEDEEEVRAVDDTEDDVEVSLESTTDIDNSDDATDDTSVDRSRPRRLFTRLWGTRKKVHQFRSDVEVDNEKDQSLEVEESDPEDQAFGEQEENITTKSSHQPNVLVRLWGTMKEPNEVYSLGIQGTKHSSFEEDEQTEVISDGDFESISESDTDETIEEVMEELEVDISVSIGNTEEGDGSLDVETFDISESSNVEDSEDEIDFSELDDIHEQETTVVDPEKNTAMEVGNDDRNVLQLHSPESQDIAQHASQASIEIKSDAAGSKDLKTSSSSHRLELRREDCDSLTLEDVSEEQNTAVATHAVSESNKIGSVDFDSDESESIGDVDGINEESVEDEGESIVLDMIEDVLSEEEEDPIEELPEGKGTEHSVATEVAEDLLSVEEDSVEEVDVEEDTEGSVVAEAIEDMSSDDEEEEDLAEEEDLEEGIEGSVVAEAIEDMFSEEEGDSIAEESQEDDIYEDTIYEDASSLYSLEVELENTNFLTRFFVNKGLEKFVMIVFLIMEWFRVYVLAPFFESIDWIKKGTGQDLLQTVMSTRGGALASSVSDSEDLHELEDEDEDDAEVEEGEGEGTYPNDDESQPRDSAESEKEALGEIESVESKQVPADISVPTQPRVPPNFVFRRLLNYGRIGHIVIMEMIMASEWLKAYVPQIPYLAGYIFHDLLKNKRRSSRDRDEPVNKRNSGFINIGEGSRLGRKPKKLRKKEDQNALDQLKRIGDVNEAKYRFLSQKFMERHALGPYSATISEVQVDLRALEPDLASKNNQDAEEVEAESDSGWILDALGVEDDEEDDLAPPGSPFDTSIGVSLGGGGPKVSVGMEFKLGRKKKSIKTSQKLRSVFDNDSMASKNKIKTPKPRVSDSESGVMGRLRAAGANSLVGRNILGAYPGDLPPPDEAANARGVIRLARRYGYGDWSDGDNDDDHEFGNFFDEQDDDDDDDDEFLDHFSEEENLPRPKQRSSTSSAKKKKTRKRRSSSREMKSAGVSFEFSSGSSKNSRISSGSSRTTTKRRRSSSSSSSSSVADSISTVRRRKSSRSRLPSSPMEKLGGIPKSTTPTAKKTIISKGKTSTTNGLNDASSLTIKRKKKTTPLRPAGALLDEAKSSAISSNED